MSDWYSPSASDGEMRIVNALLEHIDRLERKVDRLLRLIVTDKAINDRRKPS